MRERGDKKGVIKTLIENIGGSFSRSLGIDLSDADSQEIFKWFFASLLFGARISEPIVVNTYREFESKDVLSPEEILQTGWDGLVEILDAGGYVRYDFKTATKLLEIMETLKDEYNGDLNALHRQSESSGDLERRLQKLGKGIGPVTVNIFLRELRGIWRKADPLPQELAVLAASNLGLVKTKKSREVLGELKRLWQRGGVKGWSFPDFESALVRLGKDWCRKKRCGVCFVRTSCQKVS